MTKLVLLFVSAAALAAPAFAETPFNFQRNGISYVGSITEREGVRLISGHEVGSNRTFDLRVTKGFVTGNYGGDNISYPEPAAFKPAGQ